MNPKPIRLLISGDFNTDSLRDVASGDNTTTGGREYFNRIFAPYNTAVDAPSATSIKMAYLLSDPFEITTTVVITSFGLDHVLSNFADAPNASAACSRRDIVRGTDHKRTVCSLTGFDSRKVRAGMQVWDSSDPDGTYVPWNGGIVTAARRSVPVSHVKTTIGSPTYDSSGLASSLPTVLLYKACRFGTTKTRTNTVAPGAFIGTGTLQFFEDLSICQQGEGSRIMASWPPQPKICDVGSVSR